MLMRVIPYSSPVCIMPRTNIFPSKNQSIGYMNHNTASLAFTLNKYRPVFFWLIYSETTLCVSWVSCTFFLRLILYVLCDWVYTLCRLLYDVKIKRPKNTTGSIIWPRAVFHMDALLVAYNCKTRKTID